MAAYRVARVPVGATLGRAGRENHALAGPVAGDALLLLGQDAAMTLVGLMSRAGWIGPLPGALGIFAQPVVLVRGLSWTGAATRPILNHAA